MAGTTVGPGPANEPTPKPASAAGSGASVGQGASPDDRADEVVKALSGQGNGGTLFSSKYLVKAQTGYRLINDLKIALPLLAIVLLVLLGLIELIGRPPVPRPAGHS